MDNKKVLIIDDDTQILELLQMFVEANGCTAVTEASAEKGLAKIRKSEFDLILLDIMLADGNGVDVLKNIRKISPLTPVIMITGGNDVKVAEDCLQSGATDYITKPFDFEYLRTTILVSMLGS